MFGVFTAPRPRRIAEMSNGATSSVMMTTMFGGVAAALRLTPG